ncbi:MAG TPA: hypothetical protein VFA26_18040 [Gemmataceae bacterium]|nr:hypothetical protein [Gemmataceae bacterium]
MKRSRAVWLGLASGAALLAALGLAKAQQVHRNAFEGRETAWVPGPADAAYKETAHRLTDETAHNGLHSELIALEAGAGNFIHYTYPVGRAPLADDLNLSVWVKANRPGVQLLARLVLPRERHPERLDEPLTALVRGEVYRQAERWQRLEIRQPVRLAKDQQQLLRATLKRDIDLTDAYFDQLILNLYPGPGRVQVCIDDLEVGPVLDAPSATAPGAPPASPAGRGREPAPARPMARRAAFVELEGDRLLIDKKRFFLRGIRHTDTPLEVLHEAGFNAVWFDDDAPPAQLDEAARIGFWIVPTLHLPANDPQFVSTNNLGRKVEQLADRENVLFYDLGGGLTAEQAPLVSRAAQVIRAADAHRPLAGDVWDGFSSYAGSVRLLGVHRWPLMTGLELNDYRDWLNQRRLLAPPDTFLWTWVQTHLPDWYTALVYDQPASKKFGEPIGPQPEQIRLLTYTALSAGCRGLGFWSDRFLADSHQGRDRLLAMALLNQELYMLEPLLVAAHTFSWIDTGLPQVKAAVLRGDRGILVLPMWVGGGAQFVPGQAAAANLPVRVPGVAPSMQAWEVTPGDVRSLPVRRMPGGSEVIVPEFGLTAAIVFTTDTSQTGLVVHFQNLARAMRKRAAYWACKLAEVELDKVSRVNAELEKMNHRLPDGPALLDNARARLKKATRDYNDFDYRESYLEANRALRPLRILMRAHWEEALKSLEEPKPPKPPEGHRVGAPPEGQPGSGPAAATGQAPAGAAGQKPPQAPKTDPKLKPPPQGQPATAPTKLPGRDPILAVSSPYALSFYTLPRHWQFIEQARGAAPGANVLPGGDFEAPPDRAPEGWQVQEEDRLDQESVELLARRVPEGAKEGRQCLLLQIKAKKVLGRDGKELPPPAALERTFLAIHSPAVRLAPGTLVRVTGWVRIPKKIGASADGALLYDSAGGEPLAVRLTDEVKDWKKFTLYRRVPASGQIHVTMALTGLGTVYFDDVRIEPLTPGRSPYAGAGNGQTVQR